MVAKGGLFVLILVVLVIRSSTPIKRGCCPAGYKEYEPLMTFTESEDTGLLGFYVLYSPPRPKKVESCGNAAKNEIIDNDTPIDWLH